VNDLEAIYFRLLSGSDKKAFGLGRVYFVAGEYGRVTSKNCR